ncbi:DUF4756 family protein [Klebsiella pneumoniae]|nr:DUF4756 family protein [Klebsiella pneumoniae]
MNLFALVIKQRTEAALEFQRSVEQSLEQLSNISSEFERSSQTTTKNGPINQSSAFRLKWF